MSRSSIFCCCWFDRHCHWMKCKNRAFPVQLNWSEKKIFGTPAWPMCHHATYRAIPRKHEYWICRNVGTTGISPWKRTFFFSLLSQTWWASKKTTVHHWRHWSHRKRLFQCVERKIRASFVLQKRSHCKLFTTLCQPCGWMKNSHNEKKATTTYSFQSHSEKQWQRQMHGRLWIYHLW